MRKQLFAAIVSTLLAPSAFAEIVTLKVTAAGGKYYFNGELTPTVEAQVGDTLVFDLSDGSVRSHPLYLTEVAESRVVFEGAASNSRTITLEINEDTPKQIFYSCSRHRGMGGNGSIVVVD